MEAAKREAPQWNSEEKDVDELFASFAYDSLRYATRETLREHRIRRHKWWPLALSFEDSKMEDLYQEMCVRASCKRMKFAAALVGTALFIVFALQFPMGLLSYGVGYFAFLQAAAAYTTTAGVLIILFGHQIEQQLFEKKKWRGVGPEVNENGGSGCLPTQSLNESHDIEQAGGEEFPADSLVVPPKAQSFPVASSHRGPRAGSRSAHYAEGGLPAEGAGEEKAKKGPLGKLWRRCSRDRRSEGSGGGGGSHESARQRNARVSSQWEQWQGGSMSPEVRRHWKILYAIGLTGTMIAGGTALILTVASTPEPYALSAGNVNRIDVTAKHSDDLAIVIYVAAVSETLKECAIAQHVFLLVFLLFAATWNVASGTAVGTPATLLVPRIISFFVIGSLFFFSQRAHEKIQRKTLAARWENTKNANLVAETTKELSLQQRFTLSQGLFFQKIVHDLKTPLWSIMYALETVTDFFGNCSDSLSQSSQHQNQPKGGGQEGRGEAPMACGKQFFAATTEQHWPVIQAGLASTVYMQHLVMNLLEVARLKFTVTEGERGAGDDGVMLACGVSSLLRCLESSVAMMKPVGDMKAVTVVVADNSQLSSFGTSEGLAWFDQTRLLQAINNGVSNGVKFTKGGGRVEIRVFVKDYHQRESEKEEGQEAEGRPLPFLPKGLDPVGNKEAEAAVAAAGLRFGRLKRVMIEIKDTGRGIPQDQIKEIWNEYRQVEVQDASVGSGLGLSIVKAIMRAMGGFAQIASEEGEGTSLFLSVILRALIPSSSLSSASYQPARGSIGESGGPGVSSEDVAVKVEGVDDWPLHMTGHPSRTDTSLPSVPWLEGSRHSRPVLRLSLLKDSPAIVTLKGAEAQVKRENTVMGSLSTSEVWRNLHVHAQAGRTERVMDLLDDLSVTTVAEVLAQEAGAAVVLVDDQPMMLRVLEDIVKKIGFPSSRTFSFEDPEVALPEVLAMLGGPLPEGKKEPALEGVGALLLITDMQMGHMSGIALTKRIKEGAAAAGVIMGPFPELSDHSPRHEAPPPNGCRGGKSPVLLPAPAVRSSLISHASTLKSVDTESVLTHPNEIGGDAGVAPSSVPTIDNPGPVSGEREGEAHTIQTGSKEAGRRLSGNPSVKGTPWAVRVSTAPSPETVVLRCCLLSAQMREGILSRHPEAEQVMDAVLEKPMLPPHLAVQLRKLAAAVLLHHPPPEVHRPE